MIKFSIWAKTLLLLFIVTQVLAGTSHALQLGRPIKTEILDFNNKPIAKGLIYIDYFEVLDMNSQLLGKVGIVNNAGIFELFLVKSDEQRTLIGSASYRSLYNQQGQLVGYYDWSTYWVYAYSVTGKKLGKAKCIAFRGYCAAGVAAYLTGLFNPAPRQ